jgi:N12 class adenine-specific DNA methylase
MSKLQRLRDNIEALQHAMTSTSEYNTEILNKYTGFGGLTFVLNPLEPTAWTKSDMVYYQDTVRLHELLREEAGSDKEYQAWVESLKASTLTAYYTPYEVVQAITTTLWDAMPAARVLDPAAGKGAFLLTPSTCEGCERFVAYEKDLLTGLILSAKYGHYRRGDIRVAGFETIPASELGKYDLVSTNVPFGDIRVFDPEYSNSKSQVRRDAARMIHRYYVLKGLDCLREGGVLAYIITSNYLNRDSEQIGEALKQARLVGVYRLANNLFKENGTEVGTDLLVLQKDSKRGALTEEETMLLTQYEDGGCPTNMYFTCYPEHVIATAWTVDTDAYGKRAFVYQHRDGVQGIAQQLGEVLAKDLSEKLRVKSEKFATADQERKSEKKQERKSEKQEQGGQWQEIDDRAMYLVAINYHYQELYNSEAAKMEENVDARKRLNGAYDNFREKFGPLNKPENVKAAKKLNLKELLTLEILEDGEWRKADIFDRPVAFSTDEMHSVADSHEALAQSLNDYGKPDVRYMAALTGKSEEEICDELDGEIYYNPLSEEWEIKARFISGNVIEKIERIEALVSSFKLQVSGDEHGAKDLKPETWNLKLARAQKALAALQAAIPEPIPFDDLDFNLGERWVDCKIYEDFASEFFSMEGDEWGSKVEVTVKYDRNLDQYACASDCGNEKIYTQYAVSSEASQSLDGMDLLQHALQNSCPKMMKYRRDEMGRKIQQGKSYAKDEDPEATQKANTLIEEIRQGYQDWLLRQPKALRDGLAEKYNRLFNCHVKPQFDGSHQRFPGIDWAGLEAKYGIPQPVYKDGKKVSGGLYKSQEDCIWMLTMNGGGICDHEVGSGKTLIMCLAAHEMKRLGFCHKPMIIGLKANVAAIAETYMTAYPKARVLYAKHADYSGKERENFFNRMKNNDWDVVIMSHDQFGFIPQSDEVQADVIREELNHLNESLKALYGSYDSVSSRLKRGLEKKKANLAAKLQGLLQSIEKRKSDVVDFKMMGIDHIFIDESHQFKNLGFTTRHDRVAGLGNSEGSKRAYNLLMAIRTIQQRTGRDLGATFLSGTTITNSLTELYSLFRYLRPKAMAKQGITCFDAWAAIFTRKTQEYEFGLTNQIVLKERFRYFIKVPELAQFYNEITDYRTAKDVGIERPEKYARLMHIEPTPDQEEFIHTLMKFAETGDFKLIGINNPTQQQQMAKMLYATDLARKMSLDMRLIDPAYGDHPRSKASMCAKMVAQYYHKFEDVKGTQMIFSDLSTWQNDGKFNIYEEIKRKLVEDYGIPASEIRFIQEARCDTKKKKLIHEVNDGDVRILFGSTSMLGTGVNAQERVVAVHHLDTPWRPADLEQRDGRAVRKGNVIARDYGDNKVDVIIYAVKRSLDAYKFNLLHCKQTFIQQLKQGQLGKRTLDEGSMDEKGNMNFAEYMAILSGNTDLLERAKLDKKIAALEVERKNFHRDQRQAEERRDRLQKDVERLKQDVLDAQADQQLYDARKQLSEQGEVLNMLVLDGFTVPEADANGKSLDYAGQQKALGERLWHIEQKARTQGVRLKIGQLYGFDLMVKTNEQKLCDADGNESMEYTNLFSLQGNRILHTVNNGKLSHLSPRLAAEYALRCLQELPRRIADWQQWIADNNTTIRQLDELLRQTWPKEDELRRAKADLAKLDRKINAEMNGKKSNDGSEGNASETDGGLKQAA